MSRRLQAQCPNCGADVLFSADSSVIAICDYCTSTLVRQGEDIQNIGRMAELFDDHTPLALGAMGAVNGRPFRIVGRLQYRYERGIWNEWRLLFDDGEEAWLSDDNGVLALMTETDLPSAVSAQNWQELVPGRRISHQARAYLLASRGCAELVAAAGELPFGVTPGERVLTVDCANADADLLSLTLAVPQETEPPGNQAASAADAAPGLRDKISGQTVSRRDIAAYQGRPCDLSALGLAVSGSAGERREREVEVAAFQCPQCASTVQPVLSQSRSITCASCATLLDLSQGVGAQVLEAQTATPPDWPLELARQVTLDRIDYVIVGRQRRLGTSFGESFQWDEFLLHNREAGFAFLSIDNGHGSLWRVVAAQFDIEHDRHGRGQVDTADNRYHQFASYTAKTVAVSGEFFWRVAIGDVVRNTDFIAPPIGLAQERSTDEIVWSRGRWLAPEELAHALSDPRWTSRAKGGPAMLAASPKPIDFAPYQRVFAGLLGVITLVFAVAWLRGENHEIASETRLIADGKPIVQAITVQGSRQTRVEVHAQSNLVNREIEIEATLEPPPDGRASNAAEAVVRDETLSYYRGRDADGPWTEGSQNTKIVFLEVEPGPYQLTVQAWSDLPDKPLPWFYRIEQDNHPSVFFWLIGLVGALVALTVAMFAGNRRLGFEASRWLNSDYGTRPGMPPDEDDD